MRQSTSQTGAKGLVSGSVSNIASWIETFEISQNNLPIDGADTSTWKFTFAGCWPSWGKPCLTLTSGSEITVTQGPISTMLAISAAVPSSMCGDYHADLIETRADGKTVHWLHGVVTFNS